MKFSIKTSIFKMLIPMIYEKMHEDADRALPQWAKTKMPWDKLKVSRFPIDDELIHKVSIKAEDKKLYENQGKRQQKTYDDIDAQIKVSELTENDECTEIESFARTNKLMNYKFNTALENLKGGKLLGPKQSKEILELYDKCINLGYKKN